MINATIFVVFPFCMVFAALSDLLSMTIANRVSVLLIAVFAVVAPMTGMDWHTYGIHFATAAAVLVVTFGLFAMGGMGGGDAKLMTGIALWIGYSLILLKFLVYSALLGGLLTMLVLSLRASPLAVVLSQMDFIRRIADKDHGIPYGIALGIAGLIVFPETPLARFVIASLS